VDEETKFRIVEDTGAGAEEMVDAGFGDLEAGQRVKVKIPGPILESYPARGGASEVLILK
jgi:hypothetical protein